MEIWEDFFESCLQNRNTKDMTLKDFNFKIATCHIQPKLSCFDENARFPALWSPKAVQYFSHVS